ncbi:ABC transporter permease, partial [Lactobacillus crispatus]
MKNVVVSNWSLVLAFALVLVSIGISAKEKLGLTKDILISVIRAIIQLVVIGYVLKFIFHVNTLWLTLVSTIVIIFNASWNANQRDPNPGRNIWNSIIAEAVGTYATLGILIFSGVIKPVPMQVIPITGMIAGNEMVAVGLCYKALNDSFNDLHQQVLEKLALGSDIKT